jgi:cytoplasmic FMR1 interacting protein
MTDHLERMTNAILLDDSVDIESATPIIGYTLSNSQSLQKNRDKYGYGGDKIPFVKELELVSELESIIQHGTEHKHMLYTFRSCARALPQVSKSNEKDKAKIYEATWKVLRPVMEKIKNLMDFQHVVVQKFASEASKLSKKMNNYDAGSEMLLDKMVQIIDLICVLDHLKDNKTSIKDDFNCYKRTYHNVQGNISNSGMIQQEIDRLQSFLSDPRHPRRYIFHKLKSTLTLDNENVLILLIHYCMNLIENNKNILPSNKCRPHRVLPVLMNLLDGLGKSTSMLASEKDDKDTPSINVFLHKQIDIKKLSKMLRSKSCSVILLLLLLFFFLLFLNVFLFIIFKIVLKVDQLFHFLWICM